MAAESVEAKARRLLVAGRLLVERVDDDGAAALCADAKALYDKLEALSQYARRYRLDHEKQNEIAEAKLRTARKGGGLLAETVRHEGGDPATLSRDGTALPAETVRPGGDPKSRDGTLDIPEGFTRNMSSRWQALAALPHNATAVAMAEERLGVAG